MIVWKLQTVVVFSVSEETKFEVDTTSVTLSCLYHFGNVNKMPYDKTNKFLPSAKAFFRRLLNLDCIT